MERFDSAGDAFEAQEHLAHENYDVMLLNIRMPELSGLELLGDLQQSGRSLPSVVLVTAFAQHAVAAFEKHAVDYILKPFSSQRVNQALEFASRRTASERAARLLELMPHLGEFSPQLSSKIAIKSNGRILFVGLPARRGSRAGGRKLCLLQREAGSYLLRESISVIAEKLKPYGFVRIHRSVLVNAAFVRESARARPGSTLCD